MWKEFGPSTRINAVFVELTSGRNLQLLILPVLQYSRIVAVGSTLLLKALAFSIIACVRCVIHAACCERRCVYVQYTAPQVN